jgi:hypothetical protein
LRGKIGNALLTSPTSLAFDKEPDGKTLYFADQEGDYPAKLKSCGYDLIFPFTMIPLGRLRRSCEGWRTERWMRPLGVLPFLFLGQVSKWKEHSNDLCKFFNVPQIHALMPATSLFEVPFDDWTPENLRNDCWSATWDIETMRVVWARGAHTMKEMLHGGVGKPFEEFIASEPN